jgi:hypothetical protein
MTQELVTSVFGWMAILNIAVLLFTTLMIVLLQDWIAGVHAGMFQMERPDVKRAYFRYLANYQTEASPDKQAAFKVAFEENVSKES